MISFELRVGDRTKTHPLNFFATLGPLRKLSIASPCEYREKAQRTYLQSDYDPNRDRDILTHLLSRTLSPLFFMSSPLPIQAPFNDSQLSAWDAKRFSAPLPIFVNNSIGVETSAALGSASDQSD